MILIVICVTGVSLASLGPAHLSSRPHPAHYDQRLDTRHTRTEHRRRALDHSARSDRPHPTLERWGRSSSVPERWPPEPEYHEPELTSGHPRHGGSFLLRQRSTPLSRLGRQYSVSSDYVADTSLYDPSYNYPSFHGISDSLRATIGDPPVIGLGHPHQFDRGYVDSDYLLQPHGSQYYPERRKKTVRFDSVGDHDQWAGLGGAGPGGDSGNESVDYGWMTIQDLRSGRWPGGGGHLGLAHRVPHLWDRQESLDSQAR